MNEVGVLLAFAAFTGGIFAGERAGPHPATAVLIVGVVALGAAWFVAGRVRVAVVMLALALIGGAQTERALDGLAHSSLTRGIEREEPVTLSGVLVDDSKSGRFDTDAFIRVPAAG